MNFTGRDLSRGTPDAHARLRGWGCAQSTEPPSASRACARVTRGGKSFRWRELGTVDIIRGLGKAAYLYVADPTYPAWELYVFHPSKHIQGPPGPGVGTFAILPVGGTIVPVESLVALARAVLQHPIRPLQNPKR